MSMFGSVKGKLIRLPDDLMLQAGAPDEVQEFRNSGAIVSVTVTGVRDVRVIFTRLIDKL